MTSKCLRDVCTAEESYLPNWHLVGLPTWSLYPHTLHKLRLPTLQTISLRATEIPLPLMVGVKGLRKLPYISKLGFFFFFNEKY